MTEEEVSKLLQECAKTKGGALLIGMLEDAALKRMTGDPMRIQQQSGIFNFYLEIKEYLTGENT